jgi:N-acetylglutamate synthase-like GNAT family acetyltransferase
MRAAYDEVVLEPALELMMKANPVLLASGTFYVAESNDRVVIGCGGWTREPPPGDHEVGPNLGHIRHFATHPEWTNRGVGRAIYDLCEADARSVGIDSFECNSALNAEGFYSAVGFESIRKLDVALQPDVVFPGVLMHREI